MNRCTVIAYPVLAVLTLAYVSQAAAGRVKDKAGPAASSLQSAPTGYLSAPGAEPVGLGRGDFDEYNNVYDPLAREGAKEFLKINFSQVPKPAVSGGLRDAPSQALPAAGKAGPAQKHKPLIKKRKNARPLRIDPVRAKNVI